MTTSPIKNSAVTLTIHRAVPLLRPRLSQTSYITQVSYKLNLIMMPASKVFIRKEYHNSL